MTDQLFDAALGELHAVASGQPCLLVGDFNVEPTKIPCLAKGISAGLRVDFAEAWALAAGLCPAPTCKRSWTADGGHDRDFILSCPLAAAAVLSCRVQSDRWIAPHLAVRALFDYGRWESWDTQPVRCTPLWLASWLPVVDKTRGSKSVEVQRVWEVYDERLQFMSRGDASLLDDSLDRDDVSLAWSVWSRAAESALADAFQFSGGPLPSRGLVLGRGAALFRWVQLGGPWVRRARANAADALDAADVFLYRFFGVAAGVHRRLCDFIHQIVVHRRDEAIRGWRNWLREDPLVHPYRWLRPDLVPPAPFLQCEPHRTPGGSGVLSDPNQTDAEFRKA